MKKVGKILFVLLGVLILGMLILDIARVAGCKKPFLRIKTSCEYEANHSVYKELGLGYEYVENSTDDGIGGIITKVFGYPMCDVPAGNLTSCKIDDNPENEKYIITSKGPVIVENSPEVISGNDEENILVVEDENMNTDYVINLKIGDKTFDVTLEENSATKALIEKLQEGDVIVNAREYGGFEKVGNLGFDLPREDKQITTEPGDLVLYQGNQISLFYESNSWSYTKLGKVGMASKEGLKEILGDGDVQLVFTLLD